MTLLQKYANAVMDARAIISRSNRQEPKYLAIPEEEIIPLIEELRSNSAVAFLGFNRALILEQIEGGQFVLYGLTVIIRERVVA